MYIVTISGSFGAGGSVIGPAVAERLGMPFLDRVIPIQVGLGGPKEARIDKVMVWENIDRPSATKLVEGTDRAWSSYLRYFYKTDVSDPSLYHVLLDATTLSFDACTEIIVTAAKDRAR